jgi:hypothetical protein
MKIIGAVWTTEINIYNIQCDCGYKFKHRSDRWMIRCPFCKKVNNVEDLRNAIKPGDIECLS